MRIRYNSGFGGGGFQSRGSRGEPPWAHDYPTADTHLMRILKELTVANPHVDESNVLTLDDPDLLRLSDCLHVRARVLVDVRRGR